MEEKRKKKLATEWGYIIILGRWRGGGGGGGGVWMATLDYHRTVMHWFFKIKYSCPRGKISNFIIAIFLLIYFRAVCFKKKSTIKSTSKEKEVGKTSYPNILNKERDKRENIREIIKTSRFKKKKQKFIMISNLQTNA
ncbi:hypothetical protein KFK09_013159 [Dendrobium nobile]|uniref:Transmembrane protein n=1 Tax=Dendrobium nobile TaxID=94219 RepID=A0A8T3B811_DENNO|nr:hypothetical protein KFK09_013159 [Dendrobium nobile]